MEQADASGDTALHVALSSAARDALRVAQLLVAAKSSLSTKGAGRAMRFLRRASVWGVLFKLRTDDLFALPGHGQGEHFECAGFERS